MPDFDHVVMEALRNARTEYAIQKRTGVEKPDWNKIIHRLTHASCMVDSNGKSLETAVKEEADRVSEKRRPKEYDGPEYFGGRYKRYARPRR